MNLACGCGGIIEILMAGGALGALLGFLPFLSNKKTTCSEHECEESQ